MLNLLQRSQPRLLLRTLVTSSQLLAAAPSVPAKSASSSEAVGKSGGKSGELTPAESVAANERLLKRSLEQNLVQIEGFDKFVKQRSKLWNEQHEIYYGKERDFENYPTIKNPEFHPKVRLGFLPDSWFQAFYNKTGVTGPYLFLWGGVTFLLSKEFVVMDHEFGELILFLGYMYVLVKFAGPPLAAWLDKDIAETKAELFEKPVEQLRQSAETMLVEADDHIDKQTALKQVFLAKRENIALQLELAYRERVEAVHKAVKARLDYQVAKESSRRQFKQQHMVQWIVDNAVKGITPQIEKDILNQCIKDLQGIAKRQSSASVA